MRVVKIEKVENRDVYDMEVECTHCFGLAAGVYVHNSENQDRKVSRFREKGLRIHYDYSQAEVRVMAKASEDHNLMEAFYRDADIHRFVASRVYAKPEAEITEAERRFSKMAVFSLLYGKTEVGMANDFMQGDVERAKKLFNDFFTAFPSIKKFVRDRHKEALTTGKVVTIFGDILDVDMPDWALELSDEAKEKLMNNAFDKSLKLDRDSAMAVATALRHAQNYPIQSASSSLAAMGIKGLSDYFLEVGSPAKIDCFTHDSSEIDTPICDVYEIMKAIPEIAVKRPRTTYGIPMKVDIDWSIYGDHAIEMSKIEFDDGTKTIKMEFEGKKKGFDILVERLRDCGVKVDFEITKESQKGVSMKELFITRRAFSLDIGKKLPYVEGTMSCNFSEVKHEY